jgi:hypothetical protein
MCIEKYDLRKLVWRTKQFSNKLQGEYKEENMRELKHSRRNATCLGNGKKKLLFVLKKEHSKNHIPVKFIILCNNDQM